MPPATDSLTAPSHAALASALFFERTGMHPGRVRTQVQDALRGMDDGELFLEYRQAESLVFDDGQLKSASFDTQQGFGLRAVHGEVSGYAHASVLEESAIARAAATVRAVHNHGQAYHGAVTEAPFGPRGLYYAPLNPVDALPFDDKVRLLQTVDAYVRGKDARVRQVTVSLVSSWQTVMILRPDGREVADVRPLVRLNVGVVVEHNGRLERGGSGAGGRDHPAQWTTPEAWQTQADEALRQALINLDAVEAPAGDMTVVLGPGWPGVLLHEAVGHGLEGDFNRKGTSAFAGLLGQRVAAPGVTVVDDGTMTARRGSLSIDDEGTPTGCTTLIEDGILVGFLQDRLNARLMGVAATGNGRRESYAHTPMPRMTNTFMRAGTADPADILASVDKGLYAVNFGGGQVDITSGKFVFSATEAYLIEGGKITRPVRGATLIGNGPDALTRVRAIGNDLRLDEGIGTCGKDGQSVPVGVGQPTLLIDRMTVGGTAV